MRKREFRLLRLESLVAVLILAGVAEAQQFQIVQDTPTKLVVVFNTPQLHTITPANFQLPMRVGGVGRYKELQVSTIRNRFTCNEGLPNKYPVRVIPSPTLIVRHHVKARQIGAEWWFQGVIIADKVLSPPRVLNFRQGHAP